MTIQFKVGATYYDRSAVDYDTVFTFTIESRTAKTVTTTIRGKTAKRGISVYDGVEQFKPFGTHSMCAIVGADKEWKE